MNSNTFLVLCLQAIFIQTALSQVLKTSLLNPGVGLSNVGVGIGNVGVGLGNVGVGLGNVGVGLSNVGVGNAGVVSSGLTNGYGVADVAAVSALPVAGPYGGVGYGELAVSGDVGAVGSTLVTGQIPVLGSVSFGGSIPAAGVVSLAGNCGCANLPL